MKRALITGNRGFLGRHFQAELEAGGWEVHGIDVSGHPPQESRTFFSDIFGPPPGWFDLVVHCAAVIGGRAGIEGSPLETAVNLELDAAMFRWAAKARPGRVLYLSSSAVYPVAYQAEGERNILAEVHADIPRVVYEPDAVYGWSKVMGEVLAQELRAAGVSVSVVRPFSGYGTDQSPDYPFRAFVDRALRREDPFRLWCGPCTRDFIHVDDVVKGALAVVLEAEYQQPVNLCTGVATSFWDLAALVCGEAGYSPDIVGDPSAPAGVAYRVGDPGTMQQFHVPRVELAEGVRRALLELSRGR